MIHDAASPLYPEIEPYDTGMLKVSDVHQLYYEQSGSPQGKPVVFLHGGPGGGTDSKHRRYFDPKRYRIILFDQRGAGQSLPSGSLSENTTWDLVADMERLRKHLSVDQWQMFGGSWGSTLAIAYAETHPGRVSELLVRGIFLFLPEELAWCYGDGVRNMFPDAWDGLVAAIPEDEREDMVGAYHRRLFDADPQVHLAAAEAWAQFESRLVSMSPREDREAESDGMAPEQVLTFARIECHYFLNGGFVVHPQQLLDDAIRLIGIPTVIIHGRYDMVCPLANAWRLHRALPGSHMVIVPDAGHSSSDGGMAAALVRATDSFLETGQ